MQISVIVPVYQVEQYIDDTLKSLANQQGISFEVIMVDNSSRDRSGLIAKEFALKDSRFRYYRRSVGGVSDSRNYGLSVARGKYIVFCDGDDCVPAGALKKMFRTAEKEQADLVIGRIVETGLGESILYKATDELSKQKNISKWNKNVLWNFMISGKMYRRAFLKENNILFPGISYSEDGVFSMECISKAGKITGCHYDTYYYRKRMPNECFSVTQRCSVQLWNDFLEAHRMIGRMIEEWENCDCLNEFNKQFDLKCAESILNAFYRKFWFCENGFDQTVWKEFLIYYQRLDQKRKEILHKKFPDLLVEKGEICPLDEKKLQIRIRFSDDFYKKIKDQDSFNRYMFPVLSSLYMQKWVSFQLEIQDDAMQYLSEELLQKNNLNLGKEPSKYDMVIDKPVMFSSESLLWGIRAIDKDTDLVAGPVILSKRWLSFSFLKKSQKLFQWKLKLYCHAEAIWNFGEKNAVVLEKCNGKKNPADRNKIVYASGFRVQMME